MANSETLSLIAKKGKWMAIKVDFNGKYGEYYVHPIVAAVFLKKPLPGQVLFHKNTFIRDNYAGNLQWKYRKELGKITGSESKRISVAKIDKDGNVVDFYSSAREAARQNNMSYQTVLDRCHNKVKKPFELDGHNYQFDR
jgi:hypothetical protein